jgi:ubiquinone/menaquinone biosynthesis C-methylase UbiE
MGISKKADPYRKIAKKFDIMAEPFISSLRQIGMKLYPPKEGLHVLDVGCGTGTNLVLYHEAGCRVFGIDSSASMLDEAKKKLYDNAELLLGSASEMHFPDKSFDLVICVLALHEMPLITRSHVMDEIVRVLKPDGRILLIDYHFGSISFPKGWMYKAVTCYFEIAAGREHFKNYWNFVANNGIPGLIDSQKLTMENNRIVGGGNLGVYLLRAT